jgi:hypothetical protein
MGPARAVEGIEMRLGGSEHAERPSSLQLH